MGFMLPIGSRMGFMLPMGQVATMNSSGVSPGDPMSGSVPGQNRSTTPTPAGADTGGAL